MTSSFIVTFSGKSSVLQADFFPEIILDAYNNYSCALLDLFIYGNEKLLEKITKLNIIRIECDIISESYINGVQSHTIHQFSTINSNVKNTTFVEIPKHISFLPIRTKNLRSIQISITDHEGNLVNIDSTVNKEWNIICRINIKRDNN